MIQVKIGCDIVEIKRFFNLDKIILNKIFHKSELKNLKPETLAGIFAVKESCKKVFNELTWRDIKIKKEKNGKPTLILSTDKNIVSYDISISHDGGYAIATVVFLTKRTFKK